MGALAKSTGDGLTAFLDRYRAALPAALGESMGEDIGVNAAFGLDIGTGHALAIRRALLPVEYVVLDPLITYQLPRYVLDLVAAIPDPTRRLRAAAADMVGAAALVAQVKSSAWTGSRDLYNQLSQSSGRCDAFLRRILDDLNQVLTAISSAGVAVRRLADFEETGVAPAAGELDALVQCPMAGEPVSVALTCGRCIWRGSEVRSCSYPLAAGYVVAMR